MEDDSKQIAEESVAEEPVAINPATVMPLVVDPVTITSSHTKKWYDTGFTFAVNYIYAKLEYWDTEFTQAKFKAFCDRNLGNVIDLTYFERFPFYFDVNNNNPYGAGQCPGDLPNTCIQCTTGIIIPLNRPK